MEIPNNTPSTVADFQALMDGADALDAAVVEPTELLDEEEKPSSEPEYDKATALRFLKRLDPNATEFTFQTFDDDKKRKDNKLAKILHGTIDERWDELVAYSKRGAGIFVTVNETDLKGRKNENIVRVRVVFIEDDDGRVPESLPLIPQMVVKTSPGKQHLYFLTDSNQLDEFKSVQQVLVDEYGSDNNAKDITRVLRLPGFFHCKGEPQLVEISHCDMTAPVYSWCEIKAAFAPSGGKGSSGCGLPGGSDNGIDALGGTPGAPHGLAVESLGMLDCDNIELNSALSANLPALSHDVNKTKFMLTHLSPDLPESKWKFVIWGVAREMGGSDEARGMLRGYSKPSSKYDAAQFDKDFDRYRDRESGGVGIGTAYKIAAEHGVDFGLYEREKVNSAKPASVSSDTSSNGIKQTIGEVLADKIFKRITAELGRTDAGNQLDRKQLDIKPAVINDILQSAFWNSDKNSVFMLASDEQVNRHKENKAFSHLQDTCGQVLNNKYLCGLTSGDSGKNGARDKVNKAAEKIIQHYLEGHQQRSASSIETDMFIDKGFVEMRRKTAHITFKFDAFPVEQYEQTIVDDYHEHFPLFEEVLAFIIASRFAVDGRNSYLWLNCQSNWGKTFFMMLFERLGASVKVSLDQVEKFASGAPVGLDASDFVNAMVMFVEEFNRVSRELKELTGCISASPKNKMQFIAQLYSKILMSAEGVVSLEGIDGVEDQFANRFCVFTLSGDLTRRPVYLGVGKKAYFDSVMNYMAWRLNDLIRGYVALGREQASVRADKDLAGFVSRHSIKNTRKTLSNALEDIADECRQDIEQAMNIALQQVGGNGTGIPAFFKGKGEWVYRGDSANPKQLYLLRPDKVVRDWIDATRDKPSAATLRHKSAQIVKLISSDGNGVKLHRVTGMSNPKKLLKLRGNDLVTNATKARHDLVGAVDLLRSAQHNINEAKNDGENVGKLEQTMNKIRGKEGV